MWISGRPLESARRRLARTALANLGRLSSVFAHAQNAIDLAALLDQQALGRNVTVDDAGRLQLDALLGVNGAAHLAPDDRFATDHVAFHFPAARDQNRVLIQLFELLLPIESARTVR